MKMRDYFRLPVIISSLPNTLTNGTTADASQVMANFNQIVSQVNANAVAAGTVALLAAANTFTQVQSGVAATGAANFPIVSQVRDMVFNTLTSTLGTNTVTARIAALALSGYASGQVFTFVPSQTNTGPMTLNVNGAGAASITRFGTNVTGGSVVANVPVMVRYEAPVFALVGPQMAAGQIVNTLTSSVALANTGQYFTGPSVAQGTTGIWFASGTVTVADSAGDAVYFAKLWDGTTVIASSAVYQNGANSLATISLSGFISGPVGNIRMSVRDTSSASGSIFFNATGESKDSTLTATRLA